MLRRTKYLVYRVSETVSVRHMSKAYLDQSSLTWFVWGLAAEADKLRCPVDKPSVNRHY
jgi:hypothetical protein